MSMGNLLQVQSVNFLEIFNVLILLLTIGPIVKDSIGLHNIYDFAPK